MSKFTGKIDELLGENKIQQKTDGTQAAIAAAKAAEIAGKKDPTKKPTPMQKKLLQGLKKATMAAGKQLAKVAMASNKPKGKVLEAEEDELNQGEQPEGSSFPAEAEPLTTEGETFYVNLARKSLFVDLDNVSLSDAEREAITQDVQPENAKEIAKILRKIVVDYGLSENFNSKIDTLIDDLKKNSIAEADTDNVVVLVPGSFKPPHKGHYEMVKQYSETYPQGQVQVIISAPSPEHERRTLDGKGPVITPTAAEEIFKEYIRVGGLSNVAVFVSPHRSPVTAAYETMEKLSKDRPGITIILGASKKDNDWKRWKTAPDWAVKNNLDLNIWSPEETAVDVVANDIGRPYSAKNIRDNINDWEKIKDDIPIGVSPEFIQKIFKSL